ncbi:MAG: hypothetical protein KJ874_12810 [Acidobacteria bacterium]|nr:hypothetical protein [Acidobacteriota bacterium]
MRSGVKQFLLWGTGLALAFFLFGCRPAASPTWFKGNLHTHTTNSDGDTEPTEVIRWYRDHGYHFLSITDHNLITPVDRYSEWETDTFILISGNEISDRSEDKPIHLLALGLREKSVGPAGGATVAETLQNTVDAIHAGGAVPVMAHPNFGWAYGAEEMSRVSGQADGFSRRTAPAILSTGLKGTKVMYGPG